MKFGKKLIEEIKERVRVSDIVGRKVKLKPRGNEFVGLSPFSNEKTPSFTVSDEKGFYHCFSSGEHGSIFDFVMKTEKLNFKEVVEKLANEAGIPIDRLSYSKENKSEENKIKKLKEILKITLNWYQENLIREIKTNKYLKELFIKRNFTKTIIDNYKIGYSPKETVSTYNFLRSRDYTTKDIVDAGLLIISNREKKKYDRFSNRVIFPIFNYYSEVVGFGGRAMSTNQLAKYINSPSTLVYKKGDLLYGWGQSKEEAIKTNTLFIVEGYTDVISMSNIGFKNTVAPLGTAITEKQIIKSWQLANEPIICLDGDKAGQKAAERVSELILPYLKPGYSLNFAQLPEDQDPDSLILSKKYEELKSSIDNRLSLADFLWKKLIFRKNYDTPEKKAALEEKIFKNLNNIKDYKIKKNYADFFKKMLFEKYNIFWNNKYKSKAKEDLKDKLIINVDQITEKVLLGSVILFPNLLNLFKKNFESINFTIKEFNDIKQRILSLLNTKKTIENINLKTKLLDSGYQKIVKKLIDNSIYTHAPFLRFKNDFEKVSAGWKGYWDIYNKRIEDFKFKNDAEGMLHKLNKESYTRFKNLKIVNNKN